MDIFDTNEIMNTKEFEDGTEGIIEKLKHYLFDVPVDKIITPFKGRKFTQQDYDVITKELPIIIKEYAKAFNSNPTLKSINVTVSPSKENPQKIYDEWKSSNSNILDIPIARINNFTGLVDYASDNLGNMKKTMVDIDLSKLPKYWRTATSMKEDGHDAVLSLTIKFRTKDIGTESADDVSFELFYEDNYELGLESVLSSFTYESYINDLVNDTVRLAGGIENCLPVDLDYIDFEECIGTEGFLNVLARGWSRFRRVLHPLVRSTVKVNEKDYANIKSVFNGAITRSIPALKQELSTNRFVKFLIDNGALIINEKADNSFANDSKLIACVVVTFKSSKINYNESTGILTVGSKKIDIMELEDDEKFFKSDEASQVIYGGINSVISAINNTINKQLKNEHILDKMGFSVKFLNDGTQTVRRLSGVTTGSTYVNGNMNSVNTADYSIDNVNEITTQLNNKDIKIGIVSRPLEISGAGTESDDYFLSTTDLISMQGGTEMASEITSLIQERMAAVDNIKARVMATEEYKRGTTQAGIETVTPSEQVTDLGGNKSSEEVKRLLCNIYDEYGLDELKRLINK